MKCFTTQITKKYCTAMCQWSGVCKEKTRFYKHFSLFLLNQSPLPFTLSEFVSLIQQSQCRQMFRTLPSSSSHLLSCVSFVQSSSWGHLHSHKWIHQCHPYHVTYYSFATFHRVPQCKIIAIITCNRTSEPSTPPSKSAEELSKKPRLTIRKAIIPP